MVHGPGESSNSCQKCNNMPAAYDNYDYPSYWDNRDYEHGSEVEAIKTLLENISKVKKVIEIGGGFGRLIPSYSFRVKKIILTDPSAKLLSNARKKYKDSKKIKFLQSTLENVPKVVKQRDFDLAIMVRVLHHIEDIDSAFETIHKLLDKNGYFILEFANKRHVKATIRHFLGGDITYPMEIHPVDIRSKKSVRANTLPFINFHPDQIMQCLQTAGFDIIQTLSVSNIRSSFLKRMFPLKFLLDIEKLLQKPLSGIKFGPSVFVLARKRVN